MTDGISINQFRTQIDQQSTNLDAKVKLDEDGGLKTFGKSFLSKVACWFQKSSTRKAQSTEVRNSFVSALRNEYGTNEAVSDVLGGIRGNKRLSLRTAQQALSQLDDLRERLMPKASTLYQEIMENGIPDDMKKMGYKTGETSSFNQDQLEGMFKEIAKSLAKLGGNTTENVQKSTAREAIVDYMAKNLPINTVEDAVKLMDNTTGKSLEVSVQRVFDHFKGQEGGLQKLQDCSLQLMALEIDRTTDGGTLLRGNSTASKMITKTLVHMTETQNNDFVREISNLVPEEVPAPVIDPNTKEPTSYTANSSQFNNPEFFKLSNQLTTSSLNKLQNSWAKNISPETKQFFNRIMTTANERGTRLGEGVGKKTLAAVLMLRLINPSFLGQEGLKSINNQITELNKSGNPDQERLNSLNGKSKLLINLSKPLQTIANCIGQNDVEQFLGNLVESHKLSQEDVPFIMNHLEAFNTLLDSVSEIQQD